MEIADEVERVRRLSDDELLAGLCGALGSTRRWTVRVLAHLGEVEERRLQLLAGCGSLFEYCTARLGMSEDEAYRRIEVARLARRFPILFERLADGSLSLSVVTLLRARLTDANHKALVAAVSGKTISRAREVLAAWFPQPDVPASIRKLPEHRPSAPVTTQPATHRAENALVAEAADLAASSAAIGPSRSDIPRDAAPFTGWLQENGTAAPIVPRAATEHSVAEQRAGAPLSSEPSAREPAAPVQPAPDVALPSRAVAPAARSCITPLAPERYRVQFTANAELKQKLELARDLLRHAVPGGDLADIVGRALDLLLEKTLQRRFGKRTRKKSATSSDVPINEGRPAATHAREHAATTPDPVTHPTHEARPPSSPSASCAPPPPEPPCPPEPPSSAEPLSAAPSHPRHLRSDVRRAVMERDGLRCTWRSPDGVRCESRAWLEHDHIIPRGMGGADDPDNLRIRCRAHNRLAAEQAFGQATIARIITRRREDHRRQPQPPASTRDVPPEAT